LAAAPPVTVTSIKKEGYDKKMVSVSGHVFSEDYPESTMQFKKLSLKKECLFQDKSGTIAMHLWDEFIDLLKTDGTYDMKNVVVRQYEDEFFISTTTETIIIPVKKPSVLRLGEKFPLYKEVIFPVVSVSSRFHKYPCYAETAPFNTTSQQQNFFKCQHCNTTARYSNLPVIYTVKVVVPSEDEITIYHPQLKAFMESKGKAMEDNEICEALLLDEKSIMLVNRRETCIKFML